MTAAQRAQSFGTRLPQFFQLGYTLVQGDVGTLQKTITEFATEQGVLAIRELIDHQIPRCHNDSDYLVTWRTCVRPFFLTLTEPRVARSAILEMHIGTVYNVILGYNATRLQILFKFLDSLATKWIVPLIQGDDGSKSQLLELCTAILAKVIDCNTQALVMDAIPSIVNKLQTCVGDLDSGDRSYWRLQASKHLEYIQRRLAVVQGIASERQIVTQVPEYATFILRRDLPGSLSAQGPRHDNDSEDITKIRILPTMEEIMATRSDYRPFSDPSQLHLPGIQGLIDRHFRLLRDDMVGQLKECIRDQLQLLEDPGSEAVVKQQNGVRTYSYNIVDIVDVTCTRRCGLEFHLKIEQPLSTSLLTNEAREDWWSLSKRLEIGALVCLLEKGTAIFCVVSDSTIRPGLVHKASKLQDGGPSEGKEKLTLFSNKSFAYVNLCLAEPNETDLQIMLRAYQSNNTQRSLVEFPGVLLPSFKPTLVALQQIYKKLDLPFTDLLAPTLDSPTEAIIPPPLYATKPGFTFNLKCLMTDGSDLMYSPQDQPNPEELRNRSSLDEGQASALLNALHRSLALIQGPPGTGKSYTGEAIIKVLLANKERAKLGPIICVCYTNHALDQLLEHLWRGDVKQIIRIGSRSKSTLLENLNLHTVGKDIERTKAEKSTGWQHSTKLTVVEGQMKVCLERFRSITSAKAIKDFIKERSMQFHNAIFGMAEDGWTTVTRKDEQGQLNSWISAGPLSEDPPRDIDELKHQLPDTLSQKERIFIGEAWIQEMISDLVDDFVTLHDDYEDAKEKHGSVLREVNLRVLQEADIIGITTTGLARNLELLRKLDTKIMLCEEAGEVLESHILTALLPSVEHAILIGDHLQLRPQVTNYELSVANPLGEQYSLDVSLFERLVQPARPTDLRLPFNMLEIQRRMHPSVAELIRKTIYSSLKDSDNVKAYPEVVGMRKRLFWFDHDKPEARSDLNNPTSTSRTNDFEVEMVCAFLSHLVRQGVYQREDIAVLTPYLGQMHKLRKRLQSSFEITVNDRDLEDLDKEGLTLGPEIHKQALGKCLRLATVDNFQGEEASVVVISLVRSNPERQCGFLKTTNRINVLLSRAKHGMYIFGNSNTYGEVGMWSELITMLKANGNFGTSLPLQCPRHKNTSIEICELEDFVRLSPEAGCNLQCSQRLDCGHVCRSKCHSALLHKAVKCLEPCQRLKKECGHQCPKCCGEPCEDKCSKVLKRQKLVLPCGHTLTSPQCWQVQTPDEVKCSTLVEKTVPGCNHIVKAPCHEDIAIDGYSCHALCQHLLPCGHPCREECKTCRIRSDGEVVKEDHQPCTSICGRNYSTCKHSCSQRCHPKQACIPCDRPCDVQCSHSKCAKTCSEPCVPCAMETCSSACPHSKCTMPCAAPCDWIPCSLRCAQCLPCGHQCPSLCGEPCPDSKYCQVCASEKIKATIVDMLELREYREIDLDTEPCVFPDCGHVMTISSMDGQLGMPDHYQIFDNGSIIGIKSSPKPLSENIIKGCPHCRGSLRNISRYGRIVRQALLDESTKRFISWSHAQSVAFERRLIEEQESLDRSETDKHSLATIVKEGNLHIKGNPIDQLLAIHEWLGFDRYKPIIQLYYIMYEHFFRVRVDEQPYQRVYDLVQHARRFGKAADDFKLDESKIQIQGQLLASTLLFRCYLVVLGDFLKLRREAKEHYTMSTRVHIDMTMALEDCQEIITMAQEKKYVRQETEGHIFFIKLAAMIRQLQPSLWNGHDASKEIDALAIRAEMHISAAEALITEYPSTSYLRAELEGAKTMLHDGVFYTDVSVDEKHAVWQAMAQELLGTGHWYTCARGHPFTVAHCGLPMEEAKCPECGAPVGGTEHVLAEGVRHDEVMDALGAATDGFSLI
ncbi:P-loop containing nucleoside triphosphate hydrolase protein [Whalleya microplaca]|nr:P-loop containing nucleoside triphosphate hydrolase protein [Whalleya microplaca]